MILVDTSVWVNHLRRHDAVLAAHLEAGDVLCHPYVIGEIGLGILEQRQQVLELLAALPSALIVSHDEAMTFVEQRQLADQGVGWVDIHLAASAVVSRARLWTADRPTTGRRGTRPPSRAVTGGALSDGISRSTLSKTSGTIASRGDERLPKRLVSDRGAADDGSRRRVPMVRGTRSARLRGTRHRLDVLSRSRAHQRRSALHARPLVSRQAWRACASSHLGIPVFARRIERGGWNDRVVRPLWKEAGYRPGTKASLEFRANSARIGGGAHAVCFGLHVVLASAALVARHPWAALWILLPGVVIHLYPTLLQRSILLRLQPLLERVPAAAAASPQ